MMPAKSTSDHRTYSWMMYGLAGIASRTVKPSGKLGVVISPRQDDGAVLGARRGPGAPVPVGPEPIGSQPAPQRGSADAEPSRGLGQLPMRHLERVEDGLALALGQRRAVSAGAGQKHHFTELERALLQRACPAAEGHEPLAQIIAPMGRAVPERERVRRARWFAYRIRRSED